jgi:hypothetical protein
MAPDLRALAAGRNLRVDAAAAEVAGAFRRADVRSLLLRGPVISRSFFDDPSERSYADSDFLVQPSDRLSAERALTQLGFRSLAAPIPGDRPAHADEWLRPADGAAVDLHRTLLGVEAAPQELWERLNEETEVLTLAGGQVTIPGPVGRALIVTLHAAQHGVKIEKSQEDLRRALVIEPYERWAKAARLAQEVGATAALATGLRLLPEGRELADRLGLPSVVPTEIALRANDGPFAAYALEWLGSRKGLRAKASYLAHKLFPPVAFMKWWSPLARRGSLGLAVAYVWRPLWCARSALAALPAWRRARKGTFHSPE